jgi:hypothetical protein
VGSKAVPRRASRDCVGISIVPLPVEIIGHVDDVIDNF